MNHNRPVPPVTIEAMNKEIRFDDRQYLNPELQFLPDNDTDDYTMVVVMINETDMYLLCLVSMRRKGMAQVEINGGAKFGKKEK